jgi:leucyl aminopeptidase (aminopeptidase T)
MTRKLTLGIQMVLETFGLPSNSTITCILTPEYEGLIRKLELAANEMKYKIESYKIKSADDSQGLKRIREKYVNAKALLLLTKSSLTHHKYTLEARERNAKVISIPNPSIEAIERASAYDKTIIMKITEIMGELLDRAHDAEISSKNGTRIIIHKEKRRIKPDKLMLLPGDGQNFPLGEVCVAPLEDHGTGNIFFDKVSIYVKDGPVFLSNAGIQVEKGKIIKPINKNGRRLYDYISRYRGFRNIAELGIGTNPWASIRGPIVEAEKALGTCHIAFGENKTIFGKMDADIHKDGIIFKPTIKLSGNEIIRNGNIVNDKIKRMLI